jgi:tetratricopeptide (TPR) repeat protein
VRGSAAALIILDNVSEPELLSVAQLANLPHPANWLRIVATTRLGPERLAKSDKQLATVAVDSLNEEDALTLIRDHQPPRDPNGRIVKDGEAGKGIPSFASTDEEAAAREVVRELGGFTLAVEQVAVYLGLNAEHEPPSAFLKRLREQGLPGVDDLPKDADVAAQMLHQQKQLGPILQATLEPLARELPEAITALQFAALLPPDCVPWPWLKELTTQQHSELADQPAAWGKIKRRLEGMRLLTSGDAPETARMHRLVATHRRITMDEALPTKLHDYVAKRAWFVRDLKSAPEAWDLDALLVLMAQYLESDDASKAIARPAIYLTEKVVAYRSPLAAKKLLRSARRVLERLAKSNPGNVELQRDLAVSLSNLGMIELLQGNVRAAKPFLTDSLARAQDLAKSELANLSNQRDLAVAFERLGDLAKAEGDLAEAQSHYLESARISERLTTIDPANGDWLNDHSVSLNKLGELAEERGDLDEAHQHYFDSLHSARRLMEMDTRKPKWQRDFSWSLNNLGNLAVRQADFPVAHLLLSECHAVREGLTNSDPRNEDLQDDLSVSFSNLGSLAVAEGNFEEAYRLFTECLSIRRRLADSDPSRAARQREVSVSLKKLGHVALKRNMLAEAKRQFMDSLEIDQNLVETEPRNAGWQRDLWVSHFILATILDKLADPVATDHWRKAHDILAAMVQAGLHVSPADLKVLEQLRAKIGG